MPVLPARGGEAFLHALFEPLGYELEAERLSLGEQTGEWGQGSYFQVMLRHRIPLRLLLSCVSSAILSHIQGSPMIPSPYFMQAC